MKIRTPRNRTYVAVVAASVALLMPVVASASVGYLSLPSAPTKVVAAPSSNNEITVQWHAPTLTGNTPITSYTVTQQPTGDTCTWTSGPLTCAFSNLVANRYYTFTVTATNTGGTSKPSPASAAFRQTTPAVPTVPRATSNGGTSSVVTWQAPAQNGNSTITSYVATASPGGATCTWTSGPLACTLNGLTPGASYQITVVAVNGVGSSAPSAAARAKA